jgi:hypothetical protein
MNWQDRINNMVRVTGFPVNMHVCGTEINMHVDPDDRAWGYWIMGNDYRVRSGYHGGYPNTYLRRIRALFPDKSAALHVFSGMVDQDAFPGETVDINAELGPTYVDDAQTLAKVPLETYDIFLVDPPYTGEDADHYGVTMVSRVKVMRTLARRARPGSHVVWLDQASVMYRKDEWNIEASIGVERSTNHRFRSVKVFRRKP